MMKSINKWFCSVLFTSLLFINLNANDDLQNETTENLDKKEDVVKEELTIVEESIEDYLSNIEDEDSIRIREEYSKIVNKVENNK